MLIQFDWFGYIFRLYRLGQPIIEVYLDEGECVIRYTSYYAPFINTSFSPYNINDQLHK